MSEQQKLRHYREGGKLTHSGVEILPNGEDIECIVIDRVVYFDEHNVGGQKKKGVWVAYFAPNPYATLPMVLNSTNRKRLCKLAKNNYPETIHNFAVRLTQEDARDPVDGGMTKGLRISNIPAKIPAPPVKPILTPNHPDWDKCIEYMKQSGNNIASIKSRFIVEPNVETLLIQKL